MVDVNDRFETKGANVILQPEAFSAWGYYTTPWEPDIFREGGWSTLQKQAGFLVNVNASMTGNFFDDVTFDGQTAILGASTSDETGSNLNCTNTGCLFGAPTTGASPVRGRGSDVWSSVRWRWRWQQRRPMRRKPIFGLRRRWPKGIRRRKTSATI